MARLADCADETEMEEVKRWGRVGGEREKEREREGLGGVGTRRRRGEGGGRKTRG